MSSYNQAGNKWTCSSAGHGITPFQICALFGEAYVKTATKSNALSGFQKCGILSCNRDIFCDADYVVSDQLLATLHATVVLVTLHATVVLVTLHVTVVLVTLHVTVVLVTLHVTVVLTASMQQWYL